MVVGWIWRDFWISRVGPAGLFVKEGLNCEEKAGHFLPNNAFFKLYSQTGHFESYIKIRVLLKIVS